MNNTKLTSTFRKSKAFVLVSIFLLIALTFLGQIGFLVAIIFMIWVIRYQKMSLASIGLVRPASWLKTILMGVGLALLILAFFLLIVNPILQDYLPVEEKDLARFSALKGNLLLYIIGLVSAIVTAGLGEEIIWRGYILKHLAIIFGNHRTAWILALLLTSTLFGCLHFYQGMIGIVQTGLTGFLLGIIFIANGKKSLWVNIITHSVIDIISLTAIYMGAI